MCIALASIWFFSPLGVARADITSGEVQEILTILNHGLWSNDPDLNPVAEQLLQSQQDLGNGLGYFLTGYGGPDMDATSYTHKGTLPYMLQLQYAALTGGKLSAATPTTWNLRGDTTEIVSLLRSLTNSAASGSSSTSIVQVTTPISPDVLAGNPWWASNSWFTTTWDTWRLNNPYPRNFTQDRYSFPELMSILAGQITVGWEYNGSEPYTFSDWWDAFGTDPDYMAINWAGQGMTWYDWQADAMKSNLVLVTSYGMTTGTNHLVSVSQSTGAETIIDDGDTTNTNVLDELTLSRADTDAISGLTDFIDADEVGDMFGGLDVTPDPQLRIFPGGTYGDVTVAAVYADFSLPENVATMISTAARWLWRILVMVSLFCIVRQEFDYWSTLGGSASA